MNDEPDEHNNAIENEQTFENQPEISVEQSPNKDDNMVHDDREPKLYVDVNVANFGLQRIVVYEGDTVDSLVADFVKRCPIDEPMVERLKELLKKQMDGVLDRIEEDDGNPEEEEEGAFSVKEGQMMDQNNLDNFSDNEKKQRVSDLPQPDSASPEWNDQKSQL